MDKVIIEHPEHGRVEGAVLSIHGVSWLKDGAHRYRDDGWREVKPKKWVFCNVQISGTLPCLDTLDLNGFVYRLQPGYRWKRVEIEKLED